MPTTIKKVNKQELKSILTTGKVKNRIPSVTLKKLEKAGWNIYDYYIEKNYKGYWLVIEFCIGDFCVSVCSKKGKFLLEKKQSVKNLMYALMASALHEIRIDQGKKWAGEDN